MSFPFRFSLASFLSVSPHFLFGSRLYADTSKHQALNVNSLGVLEANNTNLCFSSERHEDFLRNDPSMHDRWRTFIYFWDFPFSFNSACKSEDSNLDADTELKSIVLVILAVSLLGKYLNSGKCQIFDKTDFFKGTGIGQTAITTLGIPFIDDNVKSKFDLKFLQKF